MSILLYCRAISVTLRITDLVLSLIWLSSFKIVNSTLKHKTTAHPIRLTYFSAPSIFTTCSYLDLITIFLWKEMQRIDDAAEHNSSACASTSTASLTGVAMVRRWSHLVFLQCFRSTSAWPELASANQRLYAAISPWPHRRCNRNRAA